MSKITYTNKVAINENIEIPNINKVTDSDMNEIKNVVNNNDDELITTNTNLTNATTYSTTEKVVGKWIDDKTLYRKVFTGTLANNSTVNIDISSLNCSKCFLENGFLLSDGGPIYTIPYGYSIDGSIYTSFEINLSQGKCVLKNSAATSGYSRGTYYIILNYTKTTD